MLLCLMFLTEFRNFMKKKKKKEHNTTICTSLMEKFKVLAINYFTKPLPPFTRLKQEVQND